MSKVHSWFIAIVLAIQQSNSSLNIPIPL